mmetsp:Transcript_18906/g.30133  ORF Transcript_18906/g.30133 Transcript_18906/m.30133 type:complete len:86 (-) Transcript_18906:68-325(-)
MHCCIELLRNCSGECLGNTKSPLNPLNSTIEDEDATSLRTQMAAWRFVPICGDDVPLCALLCVDLARKKICQIIEWKQYAGVQSF